MIIGAVLISIVFLFIVFLLLLLLDKRKLKKLKKQYDEKEDFSKEGERRRFDNRGLPRTPEREYGDEGFVEPERRKLLPATATSISGKDSKSSGGNRLKRKLRRRR